MCGPAPARSACSLQHKPTDDRGLATSGQTRTPVRREARRGYDPCVGKGYAEGPAAEERFAALERGDAFAPTTLVDDRQAVYAATPDNPEKHFVGWLGDVDPDELFAKGEAWGISVVRRSA